MASPSPVTAAQIEAYLATATSAYRSMRTHPRYHARSRSLVAIAVGSVLNFIGLIVAFVGDDREDAPKYVAVWVGIVLGISTCYQALDLLCSPSSTLHQLQKQPSEIFTRHFPAPFIFVMDTLGFLGFLALWIANSIVISHLGMIQQIYIYNSIPLMICCAYHASIAIQALPHLLSLQTSPNGGGRARDFCCAECKRESERRHGTGKQSNASTLLGEEGAAASAALLQNMDDGTQNV